MLLPWWHADKGTHIPLNNVTMNVKSVGNNTDMRQTQTYPRELGKAIVSAWLTTRARQESSGYLVGLQGHAGFKANDPELDTACEGREVASVGPVIPDRESDFDSWWGLAATQQTTLPSGRVGIRGGPQGH